MSDNWYILIPQDPQYVPTTSQQSKARQRFRELAPMADEVVVETFRAIRFFDCAANFQAVSCPKCRSELDMDWWMDRMNADYEDGFQLNAYDMPCCAHSATLHDLIYDWPQGFGRFALRARNPGIDRLNPSQVSEFEQLLGTGLRVIYNHI